MACRDGRSFITRNHRTEEMPTASAMGAQRPTAGMDRRLQGLQPRVLQGRPRPLPAQTLTTTEGEKRHLTGKKKGIPSRHGMNADTRRVTNVHRPETWPAAVFHLLAK